MNGFEEFMGIRVTMVDAIQRYHLVVKPEQGTEEKVALVRELLGQAASENKMMGAEGTIIGEAWQRLIDSREPEAVVKFVEAPKIKAMVTKLPQLHQQVQKIGTVLLSGFLLNHVFTLRPMVLGTENLAQETGLIDYQNGDSLSDLIAIHKAAILAEKGLIAETPVTKPCDIILNQVVKSVYNNENCVVKDEHLGGVPKTLKPSTQQNLAPKHNPRL
ncbi:MAG: hypothetical protein ACOYK8_02930 [Alphaproteobacteria bacterium]